MQNNLWALSLNDPYTQQILLTDIESVEASTFMIIALKKDGTVWTGSNELKKDPYLQDIVKISAGSHNFVAVDKSGNIYNWSPDGSINNISSYLFGNTDKANKELYVRFKH